MLGLGYIKYNLKSGQTKYYMEDSQEYIVTIFQYGINKLIIISVHAWNGIWEIDMETGKLEKFNVCSKTEIGR